MKDIQEISNTALADDQVKDIRFVEILFYYRNMDV